MDSYQPTIYTYTYANMSNHVIGKDKNNNSIVIMLIIMDIVITWK